MKKMIKEPKSESLYHSKAFTPTFLMDKMQKNLKLIHREDLSGLSFQKVESLRDN